MKKSRFVRCAPCAEFVFAVTTFLLSLLVLPARANVLPPAAILIHVQEFDWWDPCTQSVFECNDIVRNTTATGYLEFQFYLYSRGHANRISRLTTDLTFNGWLNTYPPYDWQACEGGISNWTWDGGPVWTLDVSWPDCPALGNLFLIGTLFVNVTGPGRLDFEDPNWAGEVWWECPPNAYQDYLTGACAVAGTDCEYTRWICGDEEECVPRLDQPELYLTAPVGGTAAGQVPFWAVGHGCTLGLDCEDPWAEATVTQLGENYRYRLNVKANAAGLNEGMHQTWIQIVGLQDRVARCLQVTLTVTGNSSVPPPGRQVERTWGRIKASYR